jgi:hypothetical protein
VAPISDWFSIWLDKKDLAVHYGKSYVLESVHYNGTPPMITAMANGELEIAMLAFSTFPIAVVNAGMDDLRVIADEFQDGVEGYYSDEFMVLKDGPIKKVEDLKGKIVATNAAGSGVDVAMKAMLHKHGLEQNRDYTEIEAPFPTMLPMLAEKKADLISAVLPFSLDPELKKIAAPLFTSRDAIGVTQFIMFTARKHSSTRTARRWSTAWRTRCVSCAGTWTPRITTSCNRSPAASSRRRPNASAGSSPRPTNIAIPTCCRTSTRCRGTSTSPMNSASSERALTSRRTLISA